MAARDRLGEKPFYYFVRPDTRGLIFASELASHPDVQRRLDTRALGTYLANSNTLGPSTILGDVRRLSPAHWLKAAPGHVEVGRYWDLAACFRSKHRFAGQGEAADALRALIRDSVKLRLVSDVPLGAFLSGGVDSSIVVSAMAQAGSRPAARSYSMGFSEPGYSELPLARSVSFDYKRGSPHAGLLPFEQAHWFWRNIFDRNLRARLVRAICKKRSKRMGSVRLRRTSPKSPRVIRWSGPPRRQDLVGWSTACFSRWIAPRWRIPSRAARRCSVAIRETVSDHHRSIDIFSFPTANDILVARIIKC